MQKTTWVGGHSVSGFPAHSVSCSLLNWRALAGRFWKKGSGAGLENTLFITAFAIPYGVQIWKQLLNSCFFFSTWKPILNHLSMVVFVLSVSYIWKKICGFDWLSFIFLFRVKELVFSSWPQTTEYNIQRSCSAYTFLFIWFFVFGNWSCLTFTFYCC